MRTFFIIITLFICTNVLAQKDDLEDLNKLFVGAFEFDFAKKGLKVGFLKDGEVIRIEFFYLSEINWDTMKYSEEESGIVLKCLDSYPKCIDRKIVKTKSRRPYPRTIFKVDSENQAETAMEILRRISEN